MPGSIQVSVLGFKGNETSMASSNPSVKVAMGKKEYQTSDTGDFTFALTTLRDKLKVKLIDGTETALIEVETRLIIEKGLLEETFDFQTGGNVQLKLQFVLSEEDRDRIRLVRQTALRKKHEELVNNNVKTAKTKNLRTSMSSPNISGLSSQDLQTTESDTVSAAGETSPRTIVPYSGTRLETRNRNETKNKQQMSVVASAEESKRDMRNSFLDSAKSKLAEDGKIQTVSKEITVPSKREEAVKDRPETQNALKKTSSNVRKMISTFEIRPSQVKKPRPTKTQADSSCESSDIVNEFRLIKPSDSSQNTACFKIEREETVIQENEVLKHKDPEKEEVQTEPDNPSQPQRASDKTLKNSFCLDLEHSNLRSSRLWIFPEESRTCVTTGSKLLETKTCWKKNIRCNEKATNGGWKSFQKLSKPKAENSSDSGSSGGPIGQVIRGGIMVGFAALVLLTRQ